MFMYYFFRLMCIFVSLTKFVKRGVLTFVDKIRAIKITTIIIIISRFFIFDARSNVKVILRKKYN